MTNFSAHWDYINHCPKSFRNEKLNLLGGGIGIIIPGRRSLDSNIGQTSTKSKLLCKLTSCSQYFAKRKVGRGKQGFVKGSSGDFSPKGIDFESEGEAGRFSLNAIIGGHHESRGFLLEQVWRRGIPSKFR